MKSHETTFGFTQDFFRKTKILVKGCCKLIHEVQNKVNNYLKTPLPLPDGRFELNNFIDNFEKYVSPKNYENKKIKICIMATNYIFWNCMETICMAFEWDAKYEVCVLVTENAYKKTKAVIENEYGHKCFAEKDYDIEKESPDILLVCFHGIDVVFAPNIQSSLNCFKLVVAITGELISYVADGDNWSGLTGYHFYRPDYYVVDPLIYDYINTYIGSGRMNMVEMGNAKFDGIYQSFQNAVYPKEWEKLKGKKVVLWGNTHGIYERIHYTCTFDLYAKAIFDYAKEHPDIGIIIRLHPSFINEMKRYRFWSAEDIEGLKSYCKQSDNLVWDETSDYKNAYYVADGVLTDGFCGMILSALPLMKPICACYRYDYETKPCHANYVSNLYQAHSINDLTAYLDMVRVGEDPMFERRKAAKEKYIKNFDGKNGFRIKEFIENKFFEKVGLYKNAI